MDNTYTRCAVSRSARRPSLKHIRLRVEDEDGILDDEYHQSIIVLAKETDQGTVLTETRCSLYGNPADVFPVLARTEKVIQEILDSLPLSLRLRYERFKTATKREPE